VPSSCRRTRRPPDPSAFFRRSPLWTLRKLPGVTQSSGVVICCSVLSCSFFLSLDEESSCERSGALWFLSRPHSLVKSICCEKNFPLCSCPPRPRPPRISPKPGSFFLRQAVPEFIGVPPRPQIWPERSDRGFVSSAPF